MERHQGCGSSAGLQWSTVSRLQWSFAGHVIGAALKCRQGRRRCNESPPSSSGLQWSAGRAVMEIRMAPSVLRWSADKVSGAAINGGSRSLTGAPLERCWGCRGCNGAPRGIIGAPLARRQGCRGCNGALPRSPGCLLCCLKLFPVRQSREAMEQRTMLPWSSARCS